MTPASSSPRGPSDTGSLPRPVAVGRWVFRHRTWLPWPLAVLALAAGPTSAETVRWGVVVGTVLAVLGEGLRLWSVRHIGVISRTRADRLGPLVTTGPYALVRHPLYVGNLLMWTGVACWTGAAWLPPVCWLLFGLEYAVIARWEGHLIESRYGDEYRAYVQRVPAWWPTFRHRQAVCAPAPFTWRETLFSERGTLMALAAIAVLFVVTHSM